MKKLTVILPFPTPCKALIGCQRAENVIPMLNKCTVLPAIHIIKPIISKFLKGACATSQAFCSNGKRFSTLELAMKSVPVMFNKVSKWIYEEYHPIYQVSLRVSLALWFHVWNKWRFENMKKSSFSSSRQGVQFEDVEKFTFLRTQAKLLNQTETKSNARK